MKVPFNKPYMAGKELSYITEAHASGHLSGDGRFTKRCSEWLERKSDCLKALLTHSCTGALEMAAILSEVGPGDEVIMPSYTFVSTANAFVLRGATPVFVDIREDTLNIDESKIEEAITDRTRVIVPVHYAGVSCEMDTIMGIAMRQNLLVVEDSAQGLLSSYKGRSLGSIGHMGTLSFHETKNIISGEGGAILLNDDRFFERAVTVREKGTNRKAFYRGEVDKYSWVDIGSSYLPSDLIAAYLWAQMEDAENITFRRRQLWDTYHDALADLESEGLLKRPQIPDGCVHNAHMYYVTLPSADKRCRLIDHLRSKEIQSVFHYVPLHSSKMGQAHCRTIGELKVTEVVADCLLRLPFWLGMEAFQAEVINEINNGLKQNR